VDERARERLNLDVIKLFHDDTADVLHDWSDADKLERDVRVNLFGHRYRAKINVNWLTTDGVVRNVLDERLHRRPAVHLEVEQS
jgi:hypothetical protein